MVGRSRNFRCSDRGLIGEFANVRIEEALPNSMRGSLVPELAADCG